MSRCETELTVDESGVDVVVAYLTHGEGNGIGDFALVGQPCSQAQRRDLVETREGSLGQARAGGSGD